MEDDDAGKGVGAVHEGCGTFQDFNGMDAGAVNFYSVFVAPLLAFLTDAVTHNHNAVVAHSANHGFGNSAAGCDLTDARFP